MKSEGLVEIGEKIRVQFAGACTEAVDRNGADLFGLRFGVLSESSDSGREQYLEWVQTREVRRDRDNGEDTASEPSGGCIGAVIADDHRWASFICFGPSYRVEVDEAVFAALHQPSPSARAEFQSWDSSLFSRSDHDGYRRLREDPEIWSEIEAERVAEAASLADRSS